MRKKMKILVLLLCGVVFFSMSMPVSAYTEEQKQMVKEWLAAHGYEVSRAGALQAYQDYKDGKFKLRQEEEDDQTEGTDSDKKTSNQKNSDGKTSSAKTTEGKNSTESSDSDSQIDEIMKGVIDDPDILSDAEGDGEENLTTEEKAMASTVDQEKEKEREEAAQEKEKEQKKRSMSVVLIMVVAVAAVLLVGILMLGKPKKKKDNRRSR
jgi:cobalamin biosynthesis Mg chelatase CobN